MHCLRLLWAANNEEVLIRRRLRTHRRSIEVIAEMSEVEFIQRFRLDKQTFRHLCNDLRRLSSLKGTKEISLEVKVLCTLSFLATGSYQRIVGLTQHMIQRTASRCIDQVVNALITPEILDNWIIFPQSQQERACVRLDFQRKFRLPGIIDCVDCTHIALCKPSEDEHLFYNRKGYHSLNVQMVCDTNLKIRNVNAKFGGATHDSFIWASSIVESLSGEQVWLLGDWLSFAAMVADTYLSRSPGLSRRNVYSAPCPSKELYRALLWIAQIPLEVFTKASDIALSSN